MTKHDLEPHELSKLFPLTEGKPLWDLADDIKANGQREDIVKHEGKILDGNRRYLACFRAEVKPKFRDFGSRKEDGKDPLAFVISKNLHRRHLGEADRAMIAAKIANMQEGRPKLTSASALVSQAKAAEMLNVSTDAVKRAAAVEKNGTPELKAAVADETLSLTDAAAVAKEPPKVQAAAVKAVKEGKAPTAKSAAEKKPKAGKPIFDDRPIEDTIGKLTRLFDSRANALGKCREHTACIDAMGGVLKAWKAWQKR